MPQTVRRGAGGPGSKSNRGETGKWRPKRLKREQKEAELCGSG